MPAYNKYILLYNIHLNKIDLTWKKERKNLYIKTLQSKKHYILRELYSKLYQCEDRENFLVRGS